MKSNLSSLHLVIGYKHDGTYPPKMINSLEVLDALWISLVEHNLLPSFCASSWAKGHIFFRSTNSIEVRPPLQIIEPLVFSILFTNHSLGQIISYLSKAKA